MRRLLLAVLLSGCVNAPQRVDPFVSISAANADYKSLTVAVVLSENTQKALQYTADMSARGTDKVGTNVFQDYRGSMGERADALFPEIVAMFKKDFKEIVKVDRLEDAAAVRADAVAVLDIFLGLPQVKVLPFPHVTDATFDIGAIFLTTGGGRIAELRGTSAKTPGYPRSQAKINAAVDQAKAEALARFESALLGSASLMEFARKAVPSGAVAAAPSPRKEISSDIDQPARRGPARPDDFALVVGIEEYQSLPRADFGARDAATVKKHLEALGFNGRNIITLTGQEATASKLKSYLEEWLPLNVKATSTLFVYYSGHGAPDVKTGDAYLVPWDGDPKFLKTSALPLTKLYADLAKTKARRVIVALDACFSGAGGRSVLAKGARPLIAKLADTAPTIGRITVFAAASGDEITGSLDEQGHGMFTYHLLKGLSADPKASARSLFEYVTPRVQDDARRQNRVQTPVLAGAALGEPLLAP